MNAGVLAFLLGLVEHAPTLTADAVQEYATVAHGEGGINKVVAAAQGFSKMLTDAFGIVEPAAPVATTTSTQTAG